MPVGLVFPQLIDYNFQAHVCVNILEIQLNSMVIKNIYQNYVRT